jgi:hypothetical protein
MMSDELNDIDYLMTLDPMELSTKPNTPGRRKLDAIIAYHRNQRAKKESGTKGSRPKKDQGPKVVLDLEKLGLKPKVEPIKRRI